MEIKKLITKTIASACLVGLLTAGVPKRVAAEQKAPCDKYKCSTYHVEKGDTLWSLAEKSHKEVEDEYGKLYFAVDFYKNVRKANKGLSKGLIAGEDIEIPQFWKEKRKTKLLARDLLKDEVKVPSLHEQYLALGNEEDRENFVIRNGRWARDQLDLKEAKGKKSWGVLKKAEFQVSSVYSLVNSNPLEKWYRTVGDHSKKGKYSSRTPITDWNSSLKEGDFTPVAFKTAALFKLSDVWRIGPVTGYESASSNSSYSRTHTFGGMAFPFERTESFDMDSVLVGVKALAGRDKGFFYTFEGMYKRCSVEGNVETKVKNPITGIGTIYKGKFDGSGGILSAELGAGYRFRPKSSNLSVSVGAALGQSFGSIVASGQENISTSRAPDNVLTTRDYSPNFDFSTHYVNVSATVAWGKHIE